MKLIRKFFIATLVCASLSLAAVGCSWLEEEVSSSSDAPVSSTGAVGGTETPSSEEESYASTVIELPEESAEGSEETSSPVEETSSAEEVNSSVAESSSEDEDSSFDEQGGQWTGIYKP